MIHRCWMPAIAIASAALLALPACRTPFQRHRDALGAMHARGRYEQAAALLASDEGASHYARRNELLYRLDRGAVEFALGELDQAILQWNDAERIMASRRRFTLAEQAGALLLNDTVRPYLGEPYEDMYVNVFKMLAQLERRDVVGGATVEARRMAIKADQLRDEYARLSQRVFAQVEPRWDDLPGDARRILDLDSQGRFIESPLGLLLSAATFLHAREPDNQRVAARRLQESLRAQGDLVGRVDPQDFSNLADLSERDAGLIVVAFSGRGPRKEALRFPPIIIDNTPVYFELPVMRWTPSVADAARLVVLDHDSDRTRTFDLPRIENLGRVAEVNHRRQLPLIYARTLARAAAKSVALTIASRAAEDDDHHSGSAGGFITALGGLALLAATERADLRAWEFLPGQAHAALLPAGDEPLRVRIEWLSPGGRVVYASPERQIPPAAPGAPATVVEFFWE